MQQKKKKRIKNISWTTLSLNSLMAWFVGIERHACL